MRFASAVAAIARPRPLLLVLEDLHWASPATVDAIAAVCRRLDRVRALIVGTYREEEIAGTRPLPRLLDSLGIEQRMVDVHLERFSRSDAERAIRAHTDLARADDALVDRLYAFSEGNALFLGEAIADILRGIESTTAGKGAASNIVSRRIEQLSDGARTVAEIAAICGHGCSVDVVPRRLWIFSYRSPFRL